MLIPYAVDVPLDRKPVANWLLLISILAVFALQIISLFIAPPLQGPPGQPQPYPHNQNPMAPLILTGWNPIGLFGHMWLHGGIFHLAGNMLFLWVFGNAVCGKVGNLLYFPLYLAFGLFAAAAHLILDGNPAIGASGAINGVVGMYLVLYPLNDISCFWMFNFWFHGTFSVSGFWMILLWLFFDIVGAALGVGGTAYYAHLGGFALGVALGFLLLVLNIIQMSEDERSILCLVREHRQKRLEDQLAEEARRALIETRRREEEHQRARRVAERKKQAAQSPPPELIRFTCPCGQRIKVPQKLAGQEGLCPKCKRPIRIPGL